MIVLILSGDRNDGMKKAKVLLSSLRVTRDYLRLIKNWHLQTKVCCTSSFFECSRSQVSQRLAVLFGTLKPTNPPVQNVRRT